MEHGGEVLRCLIIDDSAAFRDAASKVLERDGIHVVGTATNTVEALDRSQRLRPDVVVIDIDLGAESGFDIAQLLHSGVPPTPALILVSTHSEHDFADLIKASPALGFVPKFAFSAAAVRALVARSGV
jgi:DNA-binding NarL/FixJ family response regulator